MTRRAVSFLELKSLDDEQRLIEGWATRPEVDRTGDVVDPRGATYQLPLPLLVDHDHRSAVGEVTFANVTEQGIRFVASIAKIAEPGPVKTLCDSAWHMVKAGLRKAVSIGFRPHDFEPMPSGLKYTSWEWYELSLVSVPACAGASIDAVKSLDRDLRLSRKPVRVVRLSEAERPVSKALLRELDAGGAVSPQEAQARLLAASAKATDRELAALSERLRAVEGKR